MSLSFVPHSRTQVHPRMSLRQSVKYDAVHQALVLEDKINVGEVRVLVWCCPCRALGQVLVVAAAAAAEEEETCAVHAFEGADN